MLIIKRNGSLVEFEPDISEDLKDVDLFNLK